jgi:saccharopine dehydrogenase-like NADP-dependent oxidoreductase
MRVLVVGTGGVGESMAILAERRDPEGKIFEKMVLADYDLERAQRVSRKLGEQRFPAAQVDAFDVDAVAALATGNAVDVICNFLPMTANAALIDAALKAGVHYLDTAIFEDPTPASTGHRREFWDSPQFDYHDRFVAAGKLGLTGNGVEPGMADYYARYAADHFFDEIDEIGIRDGANLEIPGFKGMAFGFSVWATIDECTSDGIVWEADKGWYSVDAFSDMEPFFLPDGIGVQQVGHVAHDEVVHIGRCAHLLKGVKKATFKYGLGDEFMHGVDVLKSLNLHSDEPVRVKGAEVAPLDLVVAAAPDPAETGKAFVGKTSAGTWVKGRRDGMEREIYLYQVADNQETMAKYGTQAVVCQTAFTPPIVLELLATGKLAGYRGNPENGMRSPEEFCADPYVMLMDTYGFPGGMLEMESEYSRAQALAALTAPARESVGS